MWLYIMIMSYFNVYTNNYVQLALDGVSSRVSRAQVDAGICFNELKNVFKFGSNYMMS